MGRSRRCSGPRPPGCGHLRPLGPERRPIPDQRLEAFPLAELTVDEEAAQERTDRPFIEAVERAADGVDGEDRAGRLPGRLEAARLGPSPEPFQVLDDPAVQDDPLEEDDETP